MNLKLIATLQMVAAIAALTIFFSCKQTVQNTNSLRGTWKMEGYEKIIDITKTTVNVYDTTRFSCVPKESVKLQDMGFLGQFKQVAQDTLIVSSGITEYRLTRIGSLPTRCSVDQNLNRDPGYNFDVFYHTFQENYAYFKTRNVNWDSLYRRKRAEINKHTTPAKLHQLLNEMTGHINDGHTAIATPDELKKISPTATEVSPSGSSLKKLRDHVLYKNVNKPKMTGRDVNGKGLITWGVMKDNMGYIQVNGMICYLDFKIPDTVTGDEYWS